jgi:hypothetical protein
VLLQPRTVTRARRVGRVTIVERPGALIVSSAFLPRRRAVALAIVVPVALMSLGAILFSSRTRGTWDAIAIAVVFAICMYLAMILSLDRTIATFRQDRVVVRRAPIPIWPATTFDTARIESVYATVATGVAGRGGRVALDAVAASVTDGRPITIIDDAGTATDAASVATAIAEWLGSHRRSTG